MNYERLPNDKLRRFKYPNLIAELIESGYSICACADHMGLGRRAEDDSEVWAKLRGKDEVSVKEVLGLTSLFRVSLDYLFSHDLMTISGETYAFVRWKDENEKREKERQEYLTYQELEKELKEKPYLLDFMIEATKWTERELKEAIKLLKTA